MVLSFFTQPESEQLVVGSMWQQPCLSACPCLCAQQLGAAVTEFDFTLELSAGIKLLLLVVVVEK